MAKLMIDSTCRKFYVDGCQVRLNNKEFSLLEFLMTNSGKVISRTEILEKVWDRNIFCSTNTVDVHVSNLRKKVRKFSDVDFIRTIHCVGYIYDLSY